MDRPSTWEMMGRYNAPCPGSFFRYKGFLDSYTTEGRTYQMGSVHDFYTYVTSERGGTQVALRNFTKCEWEYVYPPDNKLVWPRHINEELVKLWNRL